MIKLQSNQNNNWSILQENNQLYKTGSIWTLLMLLPTIKWKCKIVDLIQFVFFLEVPHISEVVMF